MTRTPCCLVEIGTNLHRYVDLNENYHIMGYYHLQWLIYYETNED